MTLSMQKSQKIVLGILLYFGFCNNLSQAQCDSYTIFQVPNAQPRNAVTIQNNSCVSLCNSIANCYGVTEVQPGNCLLNNDSSNAVVYSVSLSSSPPAYKGLNRNSLSCGSFNNCSIFWYGSENKNCFGGSKNNATNINDCIRSCQVNSSCAAVDWDTNLRNCFLFATTCSTYDSSGVYHFEKNCIPLTTTPSSTSTVSASTTTQGRSTGIPSQGISSTTALTFSTSAITVFITTRSAATSNISSTTSITTTVTTTATTTATPTTTVSPCNSTCTGYKVCLPSSKGGYECSCRTNCSSYPPSPVCGSNDRIYENRCILEADACLNATNITITPSENCDKGNTPSSLPDQLYSEDETDSHPLAIKPAYIVLAGIGGGCLLLVLTAVIILCEYSMNGAETYSTKGTLVKETGNGITIQEINTENENSEERDDNVELNPYYNRSELGIPDFTKEENIM